MYILTLAKPNEPQHTRLRKQMRISGISCEETFFFLPPHLPGCPPASDYSVILQAEVSRCDEKVKTPQVDRNTISPAAHVRTYI